MEELTIKQHVDRLFGRGYGETGVPKLPGGGTGENQASVAVTALEEWGISERVIGMCFDTTASNTRRRSGACLRIKQKLDRELFYFACHRHILDLVLSAAFQAQVNSKMSGPDVPLFKRFKSQWESIYKTAYQAAPEDKSIRQHLLPDLIQRVTSFVTSQLTNRPPPRRLQ